MGALGAKFLTQFGITIPDYIAIPAMGLLVIIIGWTLSETVADYVYKDPPNYLIMKKYGFISWIILMLLVIAFLSPLLAFQNYFILFIISSIISFIFFNMKKNKLQKKK